MNDDQLKKVNERLQQMGAQLAMGTRIVNELTTLTIPDKVMRDLVESNKRYQELMQSSLVQTFAKQQAEITRRIQELSMQSSFQFVKTFADQILFQESLIRGLSEHSNDSTLCARELPMRGWYLTGDEPMRITGMIAKTIKTKKWEELDDGMIEIADSSLESRSYREDIIRYKIPDHTLVRYDLFIGYCKTEKFEEAVFLGIPLIDEIAECLFKKPFTQKRGGNKQKKPEIAIKTVNGQEINAICESYMQRFGELQLEIEPTRLADDTYWNRHAIAHGKMQRPMKKMDAAKCYMAMIFVINAKKSF